MGFHKIRELNLGYANMLGDSLIVLVLLWLEFTKLGIFKMKLFWNPKMEVNPLLFGVVYGRLKR